MQKTSIHKPRRNIVLLHISPVSVRHTDIGKRAERYGIFCLMKKRKSDAKILRNWK